MLFVPLIVLVSGALGAYAQAPYATQASELWIATWTSAQQIPEPQNALPADDLRDATLREVFHLSAGGTALRVHVSNAFGTEPLHITSIHIARATPNQPPIAPATSPTPTGVIDPKTDQPLTFSGSPQVAIPPGAEFVSDPVTMPVPALSDIAVSFHLDAAPALQTGHPGSRATSFYVHGDAVSAETLPAAKTIDHWYQISEIDVNPATEAKPSKKEKSIQEAQPSGAIIALGDSITDGHGATTNGNDRWTDVLAARLQASPATRAIGVANQGIGGNHLLTDGLGPSALSRFDRDVLAPAAARWLIVFEGVNDLGSLAIHGEVSPAEHDALVHRILAAYEQIITRAHAHGLRVIGATITPYVGSAYYHPDPLSEADRQAVNTWIRTPGHFDAVLDFDQVIRDPNHPDRLLEKYDCGDHLHPSPAGYKAMGESIPLDLFLK